MELNNKLNECINSYLRASKFNTISIGIYKNGEKSVISFKGSGEITDKLYYDIGSISKTITAHLIIKMSLENKLSLNDRIDKFLPLKKGLYPTIYELLTHTDGYFYLSPISITLRSLAFHSFNKYNIYNNINYEKLLKHIKPSRNVKSKYSYSDLSYAILGLIIEKITNHNGYKMLYDFIRNDLHLLDTRVLSIDEKNLLESYKSPKIKPWEFKKNNPYLYAGGISSTISDMLDYISLEINSNEEFITKAQVKANISSRIIPCPGWNSYNRSNQIWHKGACGLFRSCIIINRKRKIGACVLTNSVGIKGANASYIAKLLYGSLKRNKIKP